MRRSLLLVSLFLSLSAAAAPVVAAQACAATPEAAAQTALGGAAKLTSSAGEGYRVQDVQVDAVLRRVWVRVRRCDNPSAPAVLVPLLAPVNSPSQVNDAGLQMSASAPLTSSATQPVVSARAQTFTPPVAPVVLVHPGDVVRVVFASSAVQMELEATANQQGAVGDTVQVTLKRRANQAPDEPEHRMRGTVRADKSIEVQS